MTTQSNGKSFIGTLHLQILLAALALPNGGGGVSAIKLDLFRDPKEVSLKNSDTAPPSPQSSPSTKFQTNAKSCPGVQPREQQYAGLFHSQGQEDQCLLHFFNGLCEGTYIEMGAMDGYNYSNSYVFNKSPKLNWKGVNIEVTPENYKKLIVNRPNEIANVHAAVCAIPQTVHFVDKMGWAGPTNGILEFTSEAFRKQYWDEEDLKKAIPVECKPMQDVLDEALGLGLELGGVPPPTFFFDFWSLDVEGAEMSVLESTDFDRMGFGVIVVEENASGIEEFLGKKGYHLVDLDKTPGTCRHDRNLWFINDNFDSIYGRNTATNPLNDSRKHLRG